MWSMWVCVIKMCLMRACSCALPFKPKDPASTASVSLITKEVRNWCCRSPRSETEDGSSTTFTFVPLSIGDCYSKHVYLGRQPRKDLEGSRYRAAAWRGNRLR